MAVPGPLSGRCDIRDADGLPCLHLHWRLRAGAVESRDHVGLEVSGSRLDRVIGIIGVSHHTLLVSDDMM